MEMCIRYGGWCLAALLALAVGALLFSLHDKNQEIAGLHGDCEQLREENATLRKERSERPLAMNPSPVSGTRSKANTAASDTSSTGETGRSGNSAQTTDESGGQPNADVPVERVLVNPEAHEQGAEMLLPIAYGDLLHQLDLPPETENQVRVILKNFILGTMDVFSRNAGTKGGRMVAVNDGFGRHTAEDKARLLAELRNVLAPEELALVEEYEETLPGRMLNMAYEMQLNLYAPGLIPENQQMVKEVLVDEMLAIQPDPAAPGNRPMGNTQSEAYRRALDRLAPAMAPEQFALVERFVQQQEDMNRAAAGRMSGQQDTGGGSQP